MNVAGNVSLSKAWGTTPGTPGTPGKLSQTLKAAWCFSGVCMDRTPGGASPSALLGTLEGLGVSISVTSERRLRVEPASLVPAELLEEIRIHRAELLTELARLSEQVQKHGKLPPAPPIPALPSQLTGMISAAASGQLSGGAQLSSGLVTDLGGYVLAWSAAYLTGDRVQALTRLTEARDVWSRTRSGQ